MKETTKLENSEKSSDVTVLDLLRRTDGMNISQLTKAMGVTANAVRQRLTRLMDQQLVERAKVEREGRGRPSHIYRLTEDGRRQTGSNFADLAMALWEEVRSIQDVEVRRGLLQRLSKRLASLYASEVQGGDLEERMKSLVDLLEAKNIPSDVEVVVSEDNGMQLPVLKALGCPYTELAEQDRTICSMERMLYSELLGQGLSLSQCRLDGENCCTFEVN